MTLDTSDPILPAAMADALVKRAGDDPDALIQVARMLGPDDQARAREIARRALELAPAHGKVQAYARRILSRDVASWHFTIVRDGPRNKAYDDALRRAVRPGSRVLDIGAGTGLLAMMAARAGAAEVFTCEMNETIAEQAERVIEANALSHRVKVVARHSAEIDPVRDLGGLVDVLVSETISNDVVGEDWFPALEDAHRRLCAPDARIIPGRTIVRTALAFDNQAEQWRMGEVDGFDLTAFDPLAAERYQIKADSPRVSLASSVANLFDFDFQSGGPFPAATANVAVESNGEPANGIVQWMAVGLDEEIWYENEPGTDSCWALIFYPFRRPVSFAAGQEVQIHGAHDRRRMLLWSDVG